MSTDRPTGRVVRHPAGTRESAWQKRHCL